MFPRYSNAGGSAEGGDSLSLRRLSSYQRRRPTSTGEKLTGEHDAEWGDWTLTTLSTSNAGSPFPE